MHLSRDMRCSAMDLETPVMSADFQANTSRLLLKRSQIHWGGAGFRYHSAFCWYYGVAMQCYYPSRTGNLSIPCVVDGTAWSFLSPIHPMIPLYEEGDRTIMKSIIAIVECSSSPNDTISDICLNGQDISPMNPSSGVMAGVICLLIFRRSLLKQCSYNTSEADPPSMYMRSLIGYDSFLDLTASSICFFKWMHSSVLWHLSPLNSQNLFLFPFFVRPDIGDGALNFTVFIAMISFGVLVSEVNLSCLLLDFCLFFKSGLLSKLSLWVAS
ncbi:hypothetical protein Tco_1577871 [Tanacetum coccineum]